MQHNDHFSLNQIGYLSSSLYWGNVIGLLFSGRILDKCPIKTVLVFTTALLCISTLLFSMCESYSLLWITRFLMGLCGAFCFIGPIRYFYAIKTGLPLNFIISILGFSGFMGGVISQKIMIQFFNLETWRIVMFKLAIINFIILIFQILSLKQIRRSTYNRHTTPVYLKILFNAHVLLCVSYAIIMNLSIGIFGAFLGNQLLISIYHLPLLDAAGICSALFWGHLVSAPIINYFIHDSNVSYPLKWAPLLALFTFVTLISAPSINYQLLLVLCFLLGCTSSVLPFIYSTIIRCVAEEYIATATGFISFGLLLSLAIIQPWMSLLMNGAPFGAFHIQIISWTMIMLYCLAYLISRRLSKINPVLTDIIK